MQSNKSKAGEATLMRRSGDAVPALALVGAQELGKYQKVSGRSSR
jgi:hypothetical protein